MSDAAAMELVDRYLQAYNRFDVDAMVALLAPDIRFENWTGDRLTASADGVEAFRALAEQSSGLFSQREQKVTCLKVEAGSAVATIHFRARLAVDIPDGPRAGTEMELRGTSEFAFEDGRVTRIVDRS